MVKKLFDIIFEMNWSMDMGVVWFHYLMKSFLLFSSRYQILVKLGLPLRAQDKIHLRCQIGLAPELFDKERVWHLQMTTSCTKILNHVNYKIIDEGYECALFFYTASVAFYVNSRMLLNLSIRTWVLVLQLDYYSSWLCK